MARRTSQRAVHKAARGSTTRHAKAKQVIKAAHVGVRNPRVRTVNAPKTW